MGVRCLLEDGFVPPISGGRLCKGHLLPLAMVCYGKARYSQEQARHEARRRGKKENRAYSCPVCSTTHVGHFSRNVPNGCIRAEEVVRELRGAGFGWYVGKLAEEWHPKYVTRDQQNRWRMRIAT